MPDLLQAPLPWTAEQYRPGSWRVLSAPTSIGTRIIIVPEVYDPALAALIAAGPELLAASRKALAVLSETSVPFRPRTTSPAREIGRWAGKAARHSDAECLLTLVIAQATGGETDLCRCERCGGWALKSEGGICEGACAPPLGARGEEAESA